MSSTILVFCVVILTVAVLGMVGANMAKSQGRSYLGGFALGGLLPIVGIGILMFRNGRQRRAG